MMKTLKVLGIDKALKIVLSIVLAVSIITPLQHVYATTDGEEPVVTEPTVTENSNVENTADTQKVDEEQRIENPTETEVTYEVQNTEAPVTTEATEPAETPASTEPVETNVTEGNSEEVLAPEVTEVTETGNKPFFKAPGSNFNLKNPSADEGTSGYGLDGTTRSNVGEISQYLGNIKTNYKYKRTVTVTVKDNDGNVLASETYTNCNRVYFTFNFDTDVYDANNISLDEVSFDDDNNVYKTSKADDSGDSIFATITLTKIEPIPVTDIIVTTSKTEYLAGSVIDYTVTVLPNNATNKNYSISVEGNASYNDSTGEITINGDAEPSDQIKIKAIAEDGSGIFGTATVSVRDIIRATGIEITGNDSLTVGNTTTYSASLNPVNADNQDITWSVENGTGSATINENTGELTAISAGTVTVIATLASNSEVTDSLTVNIEESTEISRVFLYVKLNPEDGVDTSNWTINKDGWYTIGYIDIPQSIVRNINQSDYVNKKAESPYTSNANTYLHNNPERIVFYNDFVKTAFKLDDVDWDTTYQGQVYGLKSCFGATDYSGSTSEDYAVEVSGVKLNWHLDGLLTLRAEKTYTATVTFQYSDGITTDRPILQSNYIEDNLHVNDKFSYTTNDIEGFTKTIKYNGTTIDEISNIVVYANDLNFVVTYTINSYTTVYELNGGETASKNTRFNSNYNSDFPTISEPTKAGYTFEGWYSDSELTNKVENFPEKVTSNSTYYAKWVEDANVTISYQATTGGSVSRASESLAPVTGTAQGSTATAATGYHFVNWTDADGEEVSTELTFTPAKVGGLNVEATYTANFAPNNNTKYTVVHLFQNINNDEYTENQRLREELTGTTDTLTKASAKKVDGFTPQSVTQKNIAGDGSTVVEVKYDRNSYELTIKYMSDDDIELYETHKSTVKFEDSYSVDSPVITDYVLLDSEQANISGTMDAEDITINVIYSLDTVGEIEERPVDEEDPNGPTEEVDIGDGIADKYQIRVEYHVTNGTTNLDHTYVTLFAEDGETYDENGTGTLLEEQIAVTTANSGYEGGSWNPEKPVAEKTVISREMANEEGIIVYEITYTPVPVTPGEVVPQPTPTPSPRPFVPNPIVTPDVEPTETPEVSPTPTTTPEVIVDPVTPEAAKDNSWALLNLICSAGTVLLGLFLLISKTKKEEEEDEQEGFANEDDEANHYKRNKLYRLLGVVTSVASVLVFIFTEDMRAKMVIIDRWTLLMVVLLFVNVVTFYLGRRWQEDEDEEEVQQ